MSVKWSLEDSTALRDSDFLAKGTAATDSLDFLPASGTLGFESGVSELRVPVRIVDDTLEEAGETNPTGLIKSTDRPWR